MTSKCCMCKKKAWCFDDDGKTPYCQDCWDKSHKDLSLTEASKPFMDGYETCLKKTFKIIDKKIKNYKKGKLIDSNFTTEDRATAMVVLENLKIRLSDALVALDDEVKK